MNGLCDKLISDNDAENMPQKELPLYMPKDRTKQALEFSEEQKYDMLCEGKCLEQYFRITVAFWITIKLNVVHKAMPCFKVNIHYVLHACVIL